MPDSVAEQGWSVQVFDEKLEEQIGEVDVPEGEAVFDEINTSDVVPPAFYLVVVEDKGGDCGELHRRLAGRLPPRRRRPERDAVQQRPARRLS